MIVTALRVISIVQNVICVAQRLMSTAQGIKHPAQKKRSLASRVTFLDETTKSTA
jgi:hypothetical protein